MSYTEAQKIAVSLKRKADALDVRIQKLSDAFSARAQKLDELRSAADTKAVTAYTTKNNALLAEKTELWATINALGGVPVAPVLSGGDHGNNDDPPAAPAPTPTN